VALSLGAVLALIVGFGAAVWQWQRAEDHRVKALEMLADSEATLDFMNAVLRDGVLQQLGTPDEVYRHPANRFVGGFVGNPGMSFIAAPVEGGRIRLPGLELRTDLPLAARDQVVIGVRPEDVTVGAAGGPSGEVYAVEPLGSESLVVLKWAGARVVARAPAGFRAAPGEPLGFRFPEERVSFFDAGSGDRLVQ